MLSYLHAFHAGNFADVQKHAALGLGVRMLQAKPSPIALFDTHAGSAAYDLQGERARKTGESDLGIQKVWAARKTIASEDWKPLLEVLEDLNTDSDRLTVYPGSPDWFRHFQRNADSLDAWELHPAEGSALSDWADGKGHTRVTQGDGLEGLLRRLPPTSPRLLVLIDPSYEVKTDYQTVAETLIKAWKRCRHGVYMVWYPLLSEGLHEHLKTAISDSPVRKVLCQEIRLRARPERGMLGSGMMVVNPPWGFDERLTAMMAEVSGEKCLNLDVSNNWLVAE